MGADAVAPGNVEEGAEEEELERMGLEASSEDDRERSSVRFWAGTTRNLDKVPIQAKGQTPDGKTGQGATERAHQDSRSTELLAQADRMKVFRRQMWPVESAGRKPMFAGELEGEGSRKRRDAPEYISGEEGCIKRRKVTQLDTIEMSRFT